MLNFDYSNVFVKSGQNLSRHMALVDSFCRMQPLAERSESENDARFIGDERIPVLCTGTRDLSNGNRYSHGRT